MKKITKTALLILMILGSAVPLSGCWNYREVDQILIVAGIAVDKGTDNEYLVTAEIAHISGGIDSKTTSKIITAQGKTMFDAARNMIAFSGKRLYWSHAKVIILSKQIAEEGITKITDWYTRDAETRESVYLLISEGATAKEILEEESITEHIQSFSLGEMVENQVSLSKAPVIDILEYGMRSKGRGMPTIIPCVSLQQMGGENPPRVMGTALINKDKLVGFLDGDETKDLNFITDDVKGGILVENMQTEKGPALVSLEIFNSKTKAAPVTEGGEIKIELKLKTTAAIDGIEGMEMKIDENERAKLEERAKNSMKERMEALIKKVQTEYGADIFEFGDKVREEKNEVWKSVENNWEEVFKELQVTIEIELQIISSGLLS